MNYLAAPLRRNLRYALTSYEVSTLGLWRIESKQNSLICKC